MKIGLFTDGLPGLSFSEALDWLVEQGIEAAEISTGGFSKTPHCNRTELLKDSKARSEFKEAFDQRGLTLSALNCNGNTVDPNPERGKEQKEHLYQTIELAEKLGLDTVVAMSGCPGDPSGTPYPNWIAHPFQQEFLEILEWQWDKVLTPFWKEAGQYATDHGVKIAIEMHPGQSVFSPSGLRRLRDIAGPSLGANLDPSHLFYQGMDPNLVIRELGPNFVFHVHAKDAKINPHRTVSDGNLDLNPMHLVLERSWGYRTLGFGHDELWWREFVSSLRSVGYDGSLSIEHEDSLMSAAEGIIKSVKFLEPIVLTTMPEETPPWL